MPKFVRHLLIIPLFLQLLISMPVSAGLFDNNPFASNGPLEVEKAFVFGHLQEGGQLKLFWDMPDDYYLYRDRIEIKGHKQTQALARTNSPAEEKDDPLFGKVWVYHNHAEVTVDLASTLAQPVSETLQVTYQGCWEGGICYPPVTKEVILKEVPPSQVDTASEPPVSTPTISEAIEAPVASTYAASEQDQFAQMLKEGNLLVILGAFFVAGLALSLTPCVFPMIPILSSIIAGQGRQATAKYGFLLSLVYVLSVAFTYTLAGIFAGLFGENLQAMFQNPWIISVFSFIFVLLSLSMFGFYELQLPASWQTKLSQVSNSQQGGTVTGVAIMGLLSALIVGPCMAAPLAGALIYIGQTGDPVLGGSALFSLSMGMGVPLLLVGTSAGKLLPHAGLWMDKVKACFGVMLLLLAIWMLDRIVPTVVSMWLTALILVVTSVFLGIFNRMVEKPNGLHFIARGVGIMIFIYAVALMAGALSGGQNFIYPLSNLANASEQKSTKLPFVIVTTPAQLDQQLLEAKAAGQPVMLDFYADWCISCIELEHVTFADQSVKDALKSFRLVKVDVTSNDQDAKALNKEYSVIGPPALIFYRANGELVENKTIIGVVDPDDFVNHISQL